MRARSGRGAQLDPGGHEVEAGVDAERAGIGRLERVLARGIQLPQPDGVALRRAGAFEGASGEAAAEATLSGGTFRGRWTLSIASPG